MIGCRRLYFGPGGDRAVTGTGLGVCGSYRKTEALERMNIELEERVAERTAQLEVDLADASGWRTPSWPQINARTSSWRCSPTSCAIRWRRSAPRCRSGPDGRLDDPHAATARDVHGATGAAHGRLVDDLLDVSRITRGRFKLEKKPVEVATFIARAIETAKPLIDARGQRLHVPCRIAAYRRRRPDPAGADRRQSAQQRGQVHPDSGHISLQIETASRDGGSAKRS